MTDRSTAHQHTAGPPPDAARVGALRSYGILDTPAEPGFDDIVELASSILQAPVAVVNLIDRDRQWFKAAKGLSERETSLDVSICVQVFEAPGLTVVTDLSADARFNTLPHVVGDGGARFYAGVPLVTGDGVAVGTLCVLDVVARPDGITAQQRLTLECLGRQVVAQMELRRAVAAGAGSQAALRAEEAKFRAITDSIDQMVWSTRPDGLHDFYNQRWYEYTGVPEGSTDGEGWRSLFHPDDQPHAQALWRQCLGSGAAYRIEYRLRHRSGQYRWVMGRALPLRAADGSIVRWYGTCTEIEELVRARDVLARSRAELEREVAHRTAERDRVWRNAVDLLLVMDAAGVVQAANPAWRTLLGREPHEVVGRRFQDVIHPDDLGPTEAALTAMAGDQVKGLETRALHEDGSVRHIAWVTAPHGGLVYGSGRDVTEQRQAAVALAAVQGQLRQSQKMEAVGQLTGGIAHDFNNMLAIVIGSLDLLGRRLGPDAVRELRYVDAAMDGARRAAQLTQRLLAFARQQPLNPEPIEANRLVAGMSELLRHSLGAPVALETVLAGGLWRTHADPNQLENAILNLAVNARDAMPEGGRLTIETQNAALDDAYAAHDVNVQAGQYVLIAVSDTGSGMDPDTMARAFDPFFTTKEVGKGTGLGLSQVYGFVKQSGGHLKLYSEPGQGTTVKIYLPRLLGTEAAVFRPPEATVLPQGQKHEVVLVVEDQESVRAVSIDALTALGYEVMAADGAPAALLLLEAHPEINILFTDVVMPGTNGRMLAEAAVAMRPELRVLFATGYTKNAILHNGLLDPGVHLLGKPFTVSELAAKMRTVLDAPVGCPQSA